MNFEIHKASFCREEIGSMKELVVTPARYTSLSLDSFHIVSTPPYNYEVREDYIITNHNKFVHYLFSSSKHDK